MNEKQCIDFEEVFKARTTFLVVNNSQVPITSNVQMIDAFGNIRLTIFNLP